MIAAFLSNDPVALHAIYAVKQQNLVSVKVHAWCSASANAGDGVLQFPDWVFDGRKTFVNQAAGGQAWPVCERCSAIMQAIKEPPK